MPSEESGVAMKHCRNCGGARHLYNWQCPYDLHGEEDSFKTSCAVCGEGIPSGAPRVGDDYSNLYCSVECQAEGLNTLLKRVTEDKLENTEVSA